MSALGQVLGNGISLRPDAFMRLLGLSNSPDNPASRCVDVALVSDVEIMGKEAPAGVATPLWALAGPAERRDLWQKAQVASGDLLASPASTASVTVEQLQTIMPNAGPRAEVYAQVLSSAMATHGIDAPEQRAAFLAQVAVESGDLRNTSENLNYSARRMTEVWPSRFPTIQSAAPYAHNPEALANRVYADRLGNGDEASGDGYMFRGRGLMQVTGRDNYRRLGFEANPDALADPATAADTAASFWQNSGLNERTAHRLGRADFDDVSRTVNGGSHGADQRWQAYQRALDVLVPQ